MTSGASGALIDSNTGITYPFEVYLSNTSIWYGCWNSTVFSQLAYYSAFGVGTWYHLVVQRDTASRVLRLYVNGVLVNSTADTLTGDISYSGNTSIGRRYPDATIGSGNNYFNGTIDEVLIANRTLSDADVLAQYNAGRAKHADWDANGKWNSAMGFDGVDDYVDAGNNSILNMVTSISISAWINPRGFSTYQKIANKWWDYTNRGYEFFLDSSGTLYFNIATASENSDHYVNSASGVLRLGEWQFVTTTYDGSKLYLYVNGILVGEKNQTGNIRQNTASFGIGADLRTPRISFFNGSIDEVRVWNRSLSAAEIQQQYYSNLAKYAPDKWLFTSVQPGRSLSDGSSYAYSVYASGASGTTASEPRTVQYLAVVPQVVANITVGSAPGGVSVTPNGAYAYVGNTGSTFVSVIDTSTNTAVSNITVGSGPMYVAVAPNGAYAYVANYGSNTVSVIATSNNSVVGSAIPVGVNPYNVAVTPSGAYAYVANSGSNTVSVISTSNNSVLSSISVGSGPVRLAVAPSGAYVYVANWGGNVSVISTASNTVVSNVTVGINPAGVAVSPSGAYVYVANNGANSVSVIATSNNTVVGNITVGSTPYFVAVAPSGAYAYVANFNSNSVSVISTASNMVVSNITVGTQPYGVAVSPSGAYAYVTNYGSGTVSVINTGSYN
jgi:YVTN family beta-propeller protein